MMRRRLRRRHCAPFDPGLKLVGADADNVPDARHCRTRARCNLVVQMAP